MLIPRQIIRGAACIFLCSSSGVALAGDNFPCLQYLNAKEVVIQHEFSKGDTLSGILNRISVDERKLCLYGPYGWVTYNVQSNQEIGDWTKIQIAQRIMITVPDPSSVVLEARDAAVPIEPSTLQKGIPVVSSDFPIVREPSEDSKFRAGLRYGRSVSRDSLMSRATLTSLTLSGEVGGLAQVGFRWDEVPKIAVSNESQVDISFGLRRFALNSSFIIAEPTKDLRLHIIPVLSNHTVYTVEPLTDSRGSETSTEVKLSGIWALGYELDGEWQFLPGFLSRFWVGQDFGSTRFASRTVKSNRLGVDVSWLAHSVGALDLRILTFFQYEDLTVHAKDELLTASEPQDLTVTTALPVWGFGFALDF